MRKSLAKKWMFLVGLSSVVLMLSGYSCLSYRQHQTNPEDTTMPTWSQLKAGTIAMVTPDRKGERWLDIDVKATYSRLAQGMFLGILGAIVLGILMGCFSLVEAFFIPPLSLLAKVPPTAALAVFFVMVGTDKEMYVAMIAFGVLPTLAQAVYLGVKEIPEELVNKAWTLGASPMEMIGEVIIPYVMPKMIDAIRLQIGPAMVYLIAAEMVVGHEGFGYRIRLQSKLLNMSTVYPYLAILASSGYLLDYTLRFIQRKLFPWYSNGK
jgi:NitT/TauT family transport system permease protein